MRKTFTGIDHVVIAVRDLDAACASFTRMGFTVTPRGVHSVGSENHCIVFGDDYVELLALPSVHADTRYFETFLEAGEGLAAIALRTAAAQRAYTEWLWANLSPSRVAELSRPVAVPGGTRNARFRLTQLPPSATPGTRLFACEHLTRDLVWRPEWQKHANGATGIAAVAIVGDEANALAERYAKALGHSAHSTPDARVIEVGAQAIAIADEAALCRRWPGVTLTSRPRPAAVALFLRADRKRAQEALRAGGLQPLLLPDGSVGLGAEAAHGVALFVG